MLTQRYQRQESISWGCSCLLPALGPSCVGGADTNPTQEPWKSQDSPSRSMQLENHSTNGTASR